MIVNLNDKKISVHYQRLMNLWLMVDYCHSEYHVYKNLPKVHDCKFKLIKNSSVHYQRLMNLGLMVDYCHSKYHVYKNLPEAIINLFDEK